MSVNFFRSARARRALAKDCASGRVPHRSTSRRRVVAAHDVADDCGALAVLHFVAKPFATSLDEPAMHRLCRRGRPSERGW